MLEKVSAALNTTPTTILKIHTSPKIHKKKKSWGITLLEKLRAADKSKKLETALSSSVQLNHVALPISMTRFESITFY